MFHTILNALAGMLHRDRAADDFPLEAAPGGQRIEVLARKAGDDPITARQEAPRVSCWQRHALHVRALFATPPKVGADFSRWDSIDSPRRASFFASRHADARVRLTGPSAGPIRVDLRGKRIELDRLWMSFAGTPLDGASLRLSDKALRGIAANADRGLPARLCMALQSIATIDERHADIRRALLGQIAGALASHPRGISTEVSALLDAYCRATTLLANVPHIDALRGGQPERT